MMATLPVLLGGLFSPARLTAYSWPSMTVTVGLVFLPIVSMSNQPSAITKNAISTSTGDLARLAAAEAAAGAASGAKYLPALTTSGPISCQSLPVGSSYVTGLLLANS